MNPILFHLDSWSKNMNLEQVKISECEKRGNYGKRIKKENFHFRF